MATIIQYVDAASGEQRVIDFDVITGEDHQISSTVSEHPVEEGANVSDHVRPNLSRLTVKGVASQTPIQPKTFGGVIADGAPIIGAYSPMEVPGRTARQLKAWNIRGGFAPLTLPSNVPVIGGISVPTNGFRAPFVAPEFFPAEWGFDSNTVSGQFLQFELVMQRVTGIFRQLEALCLLGIPVEVLTDARYYPRMLITAVQAPKDGTTSMEFTITLQELRTAKTQRTTVKRTAKPVEKRAEATAPQGKKVAGINIPVKNSGASVAIDHALGTGVAR